MKILLVDDDKSSVALFEAALKKSGFSIVTAFEGQGVLDKAKAEKPSLILLDQVLPDISGNEVLANLKLDPETKDIPVAILSNFGQQELIQEAINKGAVDYILKYQIEVQDLVKKIHEILKEDDNAAKVN